ncbi:DNA topoisomerase [Trifolium repens]|nr:DNA topoisomerase [Trifolium repens]
MRSDNFNLNLYCFNTLLAAFTTYHHNDKSLALTIIVMAQHFVGSNNLNLLEPIGQYGSCRNGSKDHANPRHIWTNLNNVTHFLFHEEDNNLLKYWIEDGLSVEPLRYIIFSLDYLLGYDNFASISITSAKIIFLFQ